MIWKAFSPSVHGRPLLCDDLDLHRARDCLAGFIPEQRKPDEAVVLVGHGTYHQGQHRYLNFESRIRTR